MDLSRFHATFLAESREGLDAMEAGLLDIESGRADGETIHTESAAKYDVKRVDHILGASGFSRARTFTDRACSFAIHIARPGI